MSLHHNPKIVTDGLVLAYDIDNGAKSFKGKPTENLASSNFFDGNVNFTTDETIQDTLPTGKKGDVRYLNADYVVDPNRTVSIGSYTLTAGNTYTLSFYVKNINCTGFGGNLYSPTLTTSIGSITYPAVFTDRWTRVTKTFTIPTDTVSAGGNVVMSPQVFRDGGNGFFKLSMLQLEEDSFATPFVNGTRSNTQALLDMSKSKNTITATSLTYNSDGTFEFDGTSDYISVSNSSSLNPSINTLICWAKSNTSTWNEYGFLMSKRNVFVMHPNKDAKSVSYYYYLNNSWQAQSITPSDITVWNMYACSWDGTNINAYLNGELINSGTKTGPLNTSDTGPMEIGRDDGIVSRVFNGHIPFSLIYNRVLTAAEIKQNFNATRGRFGI